MLHSVDIVFPYVVGKVLESKLEKYGFWWRKFLPKSAVAVVLLENVYHLIKTISATSSNPYLMTVGGWAKFLKQYIGLKPKGLTNFEMTLDPDVLTESAEGIFKGLPPRNKAKPYYRVGSLLFIIQRI